MRTYVYVLGMLLPTVVYAGEGGIMEPNGSISVRYDDTTHFGNTTVGAAYRLPVGDYGGVMFAAAAMDSNGEGYPYVDWTSQGVGISAMLRKYDLGGVAITYTHTEAKADLNSGSVTATSDSYGIQGVYYFNSVDALLGYARNESDTFDSRDMYNVAGRYYINENLATELSARRTDSTDTYGILFTYQPTMLDSL